MIFIESVGVGQSETQLADLTDVFVLCSSPMAGDDLQAMKRGINERADLILLNKADEPLSQAAKKALLELKMSQTLRNNPAKVKCSLSSVYYKLLLGTTSVGVEWFRNRIFMVRNQENFR